MIGHTISSLVATSVGASVGGSIGPSYDAAALDYFTRAEALTTDPFDLTAINATYTTDYVKSAIDTFVRGCKTDAIWTKLTEVYLLVGIKFGAVLCKLKHAGTAALTNVNFVSGDFVAAGSGAGLMGGSSKYLKTGYNQPNDVNNLSLGAYLTEQPHTSTGGLIAARNGITTVQTACLQFQSSGNILFDCPEGVGGRVSNTLTAGTAHIVGSSRSYTDRELYFNGVSVKTDADNMAGITSDNSEFILLAQNGGASQFSNSRMAMAHIGTGLTDTDAANLSARVNALMTALGANIY